MSGDLATEVRAHIEQMIRLGHAEYVEEDAHLPPDRRRLRLTPLGEQFAEAFLGIDPKDDDS